MLRVLVRHQLCRPLATTKKSTVHFYSTATDELVHVQEQMARVRRSMKSQNLAESQDQVDMSPELENKLNQEFNSFLKEFAFDRDFSKDVLSLISDDDLKTIDVHSILDSAAKNSSSTNAFPNVQKSEYDEPYTRQELYLRRLFHAKNLRNTGSTVSNVYRPHNDIFNPPSIREVSTATLLAAGAHLGHSTSLLRQNNQPFVYGVRDGIHIIDLDKTLVFLRRAASVAKGIAERGGLVLFVGTMKGQEHSLQVAAARSNSYYVHTRWVPGTLTNSTQISEAWQRHEVDMADKPTDRKLSPNLNKTIIKPDLVVILNPVENRNLINECIASRIPTIGIIDTNSEPSLVSYPIPANDDSLRSTDLILGVLSKAVQEGRQERLNNYDTHQKTMQELQQVEDQGESADISSRASSFESQLVEEARRGPHKSSKQSKFGTAV